MNTYNNPKSIDILSPRLRETKYNASQNWEFVKGTIIISDFYYRNKNNTRDVEQKKKIN